MPAPDTQLRTQLEGWLSRCTQQCVAKAIIAPHAGYVYCGSCASHAYQQIDPATIQRVFILGPSHHISLSGCALSSARVYRTPLYDMSIDQEVYRELWQTGTFEHMSLQTDEDEHSLEMQLPLLAKVMESRKDAFSIVPVLVGSLSDGKEREYGQIFSHYLGQQGTLFIISSDFCHWGERFHYTYYDETQGEIYQSIEHLDRLGMAAIEALDPKAFNNYLKDYQNTICGRHPIAILLNAVAALRKNGTSMTFSFLSYVQSSLCYKKHDSSVSYAAGVLTTS
uniref:protein MEMO1-like isoform X2 n=1 Tax=Myxine glutinosa TaxID=7769 RepID=UPI00358F021F